MGVLFASILIILALIYYYVQKDPLYPPLILNLVWAVSFILIWGLGDFFYSISLNTYAIYIIGTSMFGVGYIFAKSLLEDKKNEMLVDSQNNRLNNNSLTINYGRLITLVFIILVISLPVYYFQISEATGLRINDLRSFFLQVRRAELNNNLIDIGAFKNIIPLSMFISLYVYNLHKKDGKYVKRTYLILIISTIFQLLTGGRAGAVYLILAIIFIDLLREKKLKIKVIVLYGLALLFVIVFIAYFVGKGSVDNTKSIFDNFDALYKDIIVYLLGGIVAFNNIVKYPDAIASNGGIMRFFFETLNSLGLNIQFPGLHMQYSGIGQGLVTNVYTIYGSYFIDYGLIGTCLLMFVYGFVVYIIYRKSKNGSNLFTALYGYFMAGLILSIYSEHFMTDLNYIIKLVLLLLVFEFFNRIKWRSYKEKGL